MSDNEEFPVQRLPEKEKPSFIKGVVRIVQKGVYSLDREFGLAGQGQIPSDDRCRSRIVAICSLISMATNSVPIAVYGQRFVGQGFSVQANGSRRSRSVLLSRTWRPMRRMRDISSSSSGPSSSAERAQLNSSSFLGPQIATSTFGFESAKR